MKSFLKEKLKLSVLPLLFLGLLMSSCEDDNEPMPEPMPSMDITTVASSDSQFSTLVAALDKANLVDDLQADGPFTVFAPNNAAFLKAGITSLDGLAANDLTPILTKHVVSGLLPAARIESGPVATLNSAHNIYISENTDGVFINGRIRVIDTDVTASNGIIHIIDDVIIPPTQSLIQIASGDNNFSELVDLVRAANPSVAAALTNASTAGLTVFAPTNDAFMELYKTMPKATLLAPENRGLLTDVLLYHVIPGRFFSTDLPNVSGEVATASGGKGVMFDLTNGVKIDGKGSQPSTVVNANILATNGLIHVIDRVLLPEM